jgi:hypothetical protein
MEQAIEWGDMDQPFAAGPDDDDEDEDEDEDEEEPMTKSASRMRRW